MSKESLSTIIQLKEQLLTQKYAELSRADSQQKIMKVFFWGGFVLLFIAALMNEGMSFFIEFVLCAVAVCSIIYGVYSMPKDDDLRRMKDKIESAKHEIEKLKGQQ